MQLPLQSCFFSGCIIKEPFKSLRHCLYFVLVHKESDSGLFYNPRVLLLESLNQTIAYSKHINSIIKNLSSDQPTQALLDLAKMRMKLSRIKIERRERTLKIVFKKKTSHGYVPDRWILEFQREKQAEEWVDLIESIRVSVFLKKIQDYAAVKSLPAAINSILNRAKPADDLPQIRPRRRDHDWAEHYRSWESSL